MRSVSTVLRRVVETDCGGGFGNTKDVLDN